MAYSIETNKKKFHIGVAGITTLFILICSTSIEAVVSIAINENASIYGHCSNKKSVAEAEKCAIKKCGGSCKIAKTCNEVGYGAIHQNFLKNPGDQRGAKVPVIGYACGQEFPAYAVNSSLSLCKKQNRKLNKQANTNICFEKILWQDQPFENEVKKENWCAYATSVTGIKNFEECVNSSRFMDPQKDCTKNVKLWCR